MLGACEPGAFGRRLARAAGLPWAITRSGAKGFLLVADEEGFPQFGVREQGFLRVCACVQITEKTKRVSVPVGVVFL